MMPCSQFRQIMLFRLVMGVALPAMGTLAAPWALAAEPSPADRSVEAGFVPLFDGVSFEGWQFLDGFDGHWTAKDGVISCDGKAKASQGGERNLWTAKRYKDFVLKAEWRLPAKPVLMPMNDFAEDGLFKRDPDGNRLTHEILHAGDSGIFLRGSVRTQVNIWSQPMGSGDINAYHKDANLSEAVRRACMPKICADHPPGQWNQFVVTMQGERVTVTLNGKTVIENAFLPDVPGSGSIGLQNHGDPIEFRNLYIKELPRE